MVQDLDEEVQFVIAARGTPLQVAPGHELCAQGDAADCVWLLHEGTGALFLYHACICSDQNTEEKSIFGCSHDLGSTVAWLDFGLINVKNARMQSLCLDFVGSAVCACRAMLHTHALHQNC